jgi:hypothetical protein
LQLSSQLLLAYLLGLPRILALVQVMLPFMLLWYFASKRLVIFATRTRIFVSSVVRECRDAPISMATVNMLTDKIAAWLWRKCGGCSITNLRQQIEDEPEIGVLLASQVVLIFVLPKLLSVWNFATSLVIAILLLRAQPANHWRFVAVTAAAVALQISVRGPMYAWMKAPEVGRGTNVCFKTCGNNFVHRPPGWINAETAAAEANDKLYCDHQWLLGIEPPWPVGFCRPLKQTCSAVLPTQYTVRIPLKFLGFQPLQYIGFQDLWPLSYIGFQYLEIRNVDNEHIGHMKERFLTRLLWDDILVSINGCQFLFRTKFLKWMGLPPKRFVTLPNPMVGERAFEAWGSGGVLSLIPLMPSYTSRDLEGSVSREYGVDQGNHIWRFSTASGSYTARRTGDAGLNWVVYRRHKGGIDTQIAEISLDTLKGKLIGWTVDIKFNGEFERHIPALLVAEEYFKGNVRGKSTATIATVNAFVCGCFRNTLFLVTLPVMAVAYACFVLDMVPVWFMVAMLYYTGEYPDDRRDEFDRTVDEWDGGRDNGLEKVPTWLRGWWVGFAFWVRDLCDWNALQKSMRDELSEWHEEPEPLNRLYSKARQLLRQVRTSASTSVLRAVARARQ